MKIILMSILATILLSCNAQKGVSKSKKETAVAVTSLIGKYKLVELNGKKVADETYYIQFLDQGRYGAFAGCNNLGGEYKLEGSKVTFSKGMSTMMFCYNENLEKEFSLFLDGKKSYTKTDASLIISNSKNVVEAKFELIK